jgi:hypothetical protein
MAPGSSPAYAAAAVAHMRKSQVACDKGAPQTVMGEWSKFVGAAAAGEINEPIHVDVPDRVREAQAPATGAPCPQEAVNAQAAERGDAEECEVGGPVTTPCCPGEPEDAVLMPTCGDEDRASETVMPYAEENAASKMDLPFPFNIWFYWLKPKSRTEGDCHEQSEMVPTPAVADPGCPEMAGPMGLRGTSDCQVDPDYPHEYPGCPHMQGCPHAGHCPAPTPPAETPKAKTGKKEVQAHPVSRPLPRKPEKSELPLEDECIDRHGVDTMECRPMDLNKVGFDPNAPF